MSRKKKTRPTTAISKRASSSQVSPFLICVVLLYLVALCLAYERKRKAMKENGRDPTSGRALQQWVNSAESYGMWAQVRSIVREAKRKAERVWPNADKTQMPALLYGILSLELERELSPKQGRKPKYGMLNRAMCDANRRASHRPRLFESPTDSNQVPDERLFFDTVLGSKAGIYKNNRRASAGLDYIAERFGNNLEMLDIAVSDKEAANEILHQLTRGDLSKKAKELAARFRITPDTSIEAIMGRIRRARERHAKTSYTLNLHSMVEKERQKTIKKK